MNGCADAASKALALTRGFGMPNTTLRHLLDAVASRRRIAASFDTSLLAMVRLRRGSALDVVRGGGSGGGRVGCGGSGNRQDVSESVIFGSVVAKDWKAETGWHPFLRRSQVLKLRCDQEARG